LRFPGEAKQSVSEGRNLKGKGDLRAQEKGFLTSAGTAQFAVSCVEIGDAAKEGQELLLGREVQAVEIPILRHALHKNQAVPGFWN